MRPTREQRFWEKVCRTDCWVWLGARNSWGYGTFSMSPGKNINASRAAWILTNGEIPDGLDVLHTCDNRLCCNPAHMYLGTDVENGRDRAQRCFTIKGERSVHAKLTEEKVRAIRREFKKYGPHVKSPSNAKELADRYGVCKSIISSIVSRRIWKHVV